MHFWASLTIDNLKHCVFVSEQCLENIEILKENKRLRKENQRLQILVRENQKANDSEEDMFAE